MYCRSVMYVQTCTMSVGSRSFTGTPIKPLLTPNSESNVQTFDATEISMEYFFASDARYVQYVCMYCM